MAVLKKPAEKQLARSGGYAQSTAGPFSLPAAPMFQYRGMPRHSSPS